MVGGFRRFLFGLGLVGHTATDTTIYDGGTGILRHLLCVLFAYANLYKDGPDEACAREGDGMKSLKVITMVMAGFFAGITTTVWAASGHVELQNVSINLANKATLQRGAKIFVNYCVSCHSASYMRYNRIAKDLGISEELMADNLMFTTDKLGNTMDVALTPEDAVDWFGVVPPDLSVIARSRGAKWLYSFLLSYYVDESKPTGVNNSVFADTAMPHVLADLEGLKRKVEHHDDDHDHGHGAAKVEFEMVTPGRLSPGEYRNTVRDLVSFLVYLGEPAKLVRYRIGSIVIGFLVVLALFTFLLKREYWRDVH